MATPPIRSLRDFFGLLSAEDAEGMLRDLREIKSRNVQALREKLRHETS